MIIFIYFISFLPPHSMVSCEHLSLFVCCALRKVAKFSKFTSIYCIPCASLNTLVIGIQLKLVQHSWISWCAHLWNTYTHTPRVHTYCVIWEFVACCNKWRLKTNICLNKETKSWFMPDKKARRAGNRIPTHNYYIKNNFIYNLYS